MDNQNQTLSEILGNNCMLASVRINRASFNKSDKALAQELTATHGADPKAAKVVKNLMAGVSELTELNSALNAVRTFHYDHTLPFTSAGRGAKDGDRLLFVHQALNYTTGAGRLVAAANKAKEAFGAVYEQRVAEALRMQGTMSKLEDYPTKDQMMALFGAEFKLMPIPAVGDFNKLALPPQIATKLGEKLAKQQTTAMEVAINDLKRQLVEKVGNMAEQLSKHASGEKTKLYDSLVGNVRRLADMLAGSGLDADPTLAGITDKLQTLVVHNKETLKANPTLAGEVAAKAAEVVKSIKQAPVASAPTTVSTPPQQEEAPAITPEPVDNSAQTAAPAPTTSTPPQQEGDTKALATAWANRLGRNPYVMDVKSWEELMAEADEEEADDNKADEEGGFDFDSVYY